MSRAGWLVLAVGFAAGAAIAAVPPSPAADAGPFRVVIDRMTHNRKVTVSFAPGEPTSRRIRSTRTVQLQFGVYARDHERHPGLAAFQITGMTAETAGRAARLSFYGGMLELPGDSALLRAYVYASALPPTVEEVRSVEGLLVAYDRSGPVEVDVPLAGGVPVSAQTEEVRATLRELSESAGKATATVNVDAPANTTLLNTAGDVSGVSLLSQDRRLSTTAQGACRILRPNQIEYRVSFDGYQFAPAFLHVRVLRRGGTRRVYPFRVEHIPVPLRPPAKE